MRRNNRGFTLVELIATVVVVTLVMGIAIPYVIKLINNSKDNSRVLALNNIKTSARYYTDDNKSEIIWTKEGSESEKSYTCVSINDLINKGYLKKTDIKSDLSITTTTNIIVQKDENGVIYNEEIDENVCKNRPNVLPLPTNKLCTSATYSGSVNNLIDINKIGREELRVKYKFTGHENKINAGDYKITVELNPSNNDELLYWEDGTTTAKEITCSIKKAIPEITVVPVGSDSSISENTTATLKSNVEGKVSLKSSNTNYVTASIDGNTIAKNRNKTININKLSSRNTNTYLTITVNPTDFKNYYSGSTVYTVGKLTNIETKVPTSAYCQDLTYNGTTQELVYAPGSKDSPKVAGYTFIEKTAMNAGTYTVTARLKWGYVWSDKTKDDKTIKCTIKKADPTLSLSPTSGTTIVGYPMTFNEAATVKGKYTVTSNDTSIATVAQESNNEIAVSTNNKVTVTPKKVGNTKIVVKFNPTDAVNYNSRLGTYSVNILKQVPVPTTAKCSNPTYDGTNQTIVKAADTGYTWTDGTKRTSAGSQNVTASLSTGYRWDNNKTADVTVSCKINPKTPTISLAAKTGATYTGSAIAADTAIVNPTNAGTPTYTYYTDNKCTSGATTTAPKNAGTYYVKATVASSTNYNSSSSTCTIHTINKKIPTVTLGAKTSNYTGSAIVADTATVSPNSGGSITYTYYTNSACSTNTSSTSGGAASNGAAPKNAGTYYVKATVAAKGNYGSASSSCTTHTINKVASSFNCDNKKYTGATLTIAKDASGCTLSGHQKKAVDSYTVTCNGDGNHNNATAKKCTIRYPNCTVTYDPNGGTFTTHNSNDEKIQTVAFGSYFGDETNGMRDAQGGQYSAVRNGYHIDSNDAWKCDSNCVNTTYSETKMYQAQEICASLTSTSADKSVTLKVNWKPNKTDAKCPTLDDYSGTYDGKEHKISVSGSNLGGDINYSINNKDWSTIKPSRTDAGTTTVYVKVVGDSSHKDVTCGNKKIVISKANSSFDCVNRVGNGSTQTIATNSSGCDLNGHKKKDVGTYTVTCEGDKNHKDSSKSCSIRMPKCNITFDPNGGSFENHADNVTQSISYSTSTTVPLRDAKDGYYKAKRAKYTISPTKAWKCSGDCVQEIYNENNEYKGSEICKGLSETSGDKSVTLKVNWKENKATITCLNPDYNGKAQTIATCSGGSITTDVTKKAAGDYEVKCKGDDNHTNADDKTCSIKKVCGETYPEACNQYYLCDNASEDGDKIKGYTNIRTSASYVSDCENCSNGLINGKTCGKIGGKYISCLSLPFKTKMYVVGSSGKFKKVYVNNAFRYVNEKCLKSVSKIKDVDSSSSSGRCDSKCKG